MKSTPELIKGELYHLMTHLVFPAENAIAKIFTTGSSSST